MKKISLALLVFGAFLISCQTKLDEGMVARVNKTNISQEEFDEKLAMIQKQSEAQGQILTEADLEEMKPRLLDFMVQQTILKNKAESLGITVENEAVQADLDMFKTRFGGEEPFSKWLESSGYTEEKLKGEIRIQKMIDQLLKQEVLDTLVIADEEARAFYDENKTAYFMEPESVDCSHILIMVNDEQNEAQALDKIQEIKKKVEEGMDFGEAASVYSEGPSKDNQGKLGLIVRGQTVPPFEEAAFSQDIGVVGEPVLTQFGYHLILVNEKKAEAETPFDKVVEPIKENLKQQKAQEDSRKYMDNLKEKARVVLADWAKEAKENTAGEEENQEPGQKNGGQDASSKN